MRQLLPSRARVGLERLRQVLDDVTTALSRPKKPPARVRPAPDKPDKTARADTATETEVASRPSTEGSSAPPAEPAPDAITHRVVFQHLDEEVDVGPDESILDAGRQAGLDLDFSCTVGGCAACALQVVEGEVVYDVPTCLTDDELESGMCLACVGRPAGDLILTSRY